MSDVNVRYIVGDVEASIQFYRHFLDFSLQMQPAPGFAALKRGNLVLLLNAPGAGGAGRETQDGVSPKPGGWNRMQIRIDDIEARVRRLREEGATFRNGIVSGKGGKQILLEDPSGNPIELFERAKDAVDPVPEGYHTITPFIVAREAESLIAFLEKAFGGRVAYMMKSEDGSVRHSTIRIGDSLVMISSGSEQYRSRPAMLHLYVEDVDAVYERAIRSGGESLREPENMFYGDRSAGVKDAWDNEWWISTHIEDVSDEEMRRRERAFPEGMEEEDGG